MEIRRKGLVTLLSMWVMLVGFVGEAPGAYSSLEALEEETPELPSQPRRDDSSAREKPLEKPATGNNSIRQGKTWFGMGYEQRMRSFSGSGSRGRGGRGRGRR